MSRTTALSLFLGFWASLYLLDQHLKTKRTGIGRAYCLFLERTGISVSVAQLRFYTTALNRSFTRISTWRPKVLRVWFTCGVIFGLVAQVLSVVILCFVLINSLKRKPAKEQILTPVMPGVNLPSNQFGFYMITLLLCGVLHELGHAVAAAREQVRVHGFGVFLLGVYPGAFVDMSSECLASQSPMAQLRIYCAGVWHNAVIVVIAILILITLPYSLSVGYKQNEGVLITEVMPGSAVFGRRGLFRGDEILSVNECNVRSTSDWLRCLGMHILKPGSGYCLTEEYIKQQDISVKGREYGCLPVRPVVDQRSCRLTSDCYQPARPATCAYPSLDNSTRLLRVSARSRPPLLFLGHPLDLHRSVTLSDYIPRSVVVPLDLPYIIEMFSKYLISLSGALAILNVVPCYALDGYHMLRATLDLLLTPLLPAQSERETVFAVVILLGTLLLAVNLILAMWTLFIS